MPDAALFVKESAPRERMAVNATLYLHLDHRAVHEAKVACDRDGVRGLVKALVDALGRDPHGKRGQIGRGFGGERRDQAGIDPARQ